MSDEILKGVVQDVNKIEEEMEKASTLISFLRDAGEDTAEAETELRKLEIKKEKYKRTLKDRGYEA